ncbi:hypothetical protein [Flavobacterium palustre]|uniref:hypothetical protein n=1 Tax=Flavobacterium palustre TaxID=1476463 RepID=UPI0036178294
MSNISIWYRPLDAASKESIQQEVPEFEKAYPEPQKFGIIPAYGFFIRHTKNIELNNINLHLMGNETRPALIVNDVNGIKLRNITLDKGTNSASLVMKNVTNLSVKDSEPLKDLDIKQIQTKSY